MKNNFSTDSDKYALYRPSYPNELFDFIYHLLPEKNNAWDCGTGNGQVASVLSKQFCHVYATDISQSQIDNAVKAQNITYSLQPAEKTNFPDNYFDLVVVAQAIHWFDFEKFYQEVKRTIKAEAIICVIGYGKLTVNNEIDAIINHFYHAIIGKYWDKERRYIDENYQTIPFPFKEIKAPLFVNTKFWTLDHLIGYINTWSAVKHFIRKNNFNPVDDLEEKLKLVWEKNAIKEVNFPVLLRIGIL